jgi:4-amino-4-deoxy-L-arabinose transferase-like glycosyltransferase
VPISRQDRLWIAVIVASFLFGLLVSWERWASPLIDSGREMNQPLRLVSGETLYLDVRHIYGPLSPWLHALLYRLFGPSVTLLAVDGVVCATIILSLVYWLGRQCMTAAGAGAATLSVTWLCAFKPAGNYFLPYAYSALHGTTLGLITLAILVHTIKTASNGRIGGWLLAGVVAGLAVLAKTEMGAAAAAAGCIAAIVSAEGDQARIVRQLSAFTLPAALLAIGVYALIAARVGWSTLSQDAWLFLYNVPPALAHYNARISGLDHPARSIERIFIAAVKLGVVAALIAAIATLIARRRGAGVSTRNGSSDGILGSILSNPWRALAAAGIAMLLLSVTTGFDWDKGPFLAMPFLLAGLLVMLTRGLRRATSRSQALRTRILVVCTVYALVSLGRMILHVRSGGAYGSYLLPMSVVLFTFLWLVPFARRFRDLRVRRIVRTLVLTVVVGDAVVTAGVLAFRYQRRHATPIATERGRIFAERDVGVAWNEALAYLARETRPGEPVAVMPEGTSLLFLSGRKNPLREEITTPGYLDAAGEERAIRQLASSGTRLVLLANRPTTEFGATAFGRDYCQRLMAWIEQHYVECAIFGPVKDRPLAIGDKPFFLRAYCARSSRAVSLSTAESN